MEHVYNPKDLLPRYDVMLEKYLFSFLGFNFWWPMEAQVNLNSMDAVVYRNRLMEKYNVSFNDVIES